MNTALKLISVNIGVPRVIGLERGEDVLSSIGKQPVTAATVRVGTTSIEGDRQADLENHGGADKAVYAYPASNWPWWENEKNLMCQPGTFGENLTLGGADEDTVCIGDRFAWGDAVLEVSQPRAPCSKLGIHTGRNDVPQVMTLSGRCGWYLRVLSPGAAPVDGELRRIQSVGGPAVRDTFLAVFSRDPDMALLRRIHDCPALSAAWHKRATKKIAGRLP